LLLLRWIDISEERSRDESDDFRAECRVARPGVDCDGASVVWFRFEVRDLYTLRGRRQPERRHRQSERIVSLCGRGWPRPLQAPFSRRAVSKSAAAQTAGHWRTALCPQSPGLFYG